MARKKRNKYVLDALEDIIYEEEVDSLFNDLITHDYSNVKLFLPKEGYDLSKMSEEDRFLALLAGACYEFDGGEQEIGEYAQILTDDMLGDIEILDPSIIRNEPYYKLLSKVAPFQVKNIEFKQEKFAPFQPFLSKRRQFCSDFRVTPKPSIACFKEEVSYPALSCAGRTWMSLVPHEINSMIEDFAAFKGDVLIYGLGLGYAAFEASEKGSVDSVTVVEKDPLIIKAFKEHFLPLFPNKTKIKIVQADAIEFASSHQEKEYDVLFADLWYTGEDGLGIYAELKRHEGAAKHNYYWVEEEMLIYFRRLYLRFLAAVSEEDEVFLDDVNGSIYYKDIAKAYLDTPHEPFDVEAILQKENLEKEILRIIHTR